MKTTTTILCAFMLILATYTRSFAQLGAAKPEDVAAIKARTLIVVVEQPNPNVMDKLKKKNKESYIDDYKKAIDTYNDNMKDAVEKFWTFSSKIEYKTPDEVESLVKSKSRSYAVLRCITMRGDLDGIGIHSGLNWTYSDFKNGQKEDHDFWSSTTLMEVSLIEKADKFRPVYMFGLQDIFPLESDVIFGMQSMQWYLTQRATKTKNSEMRDMIKANAPQLKDKILVLRKDLLDPKLTNSGIKAVYPYKFEVDQTDVYDQHIINSDDGYAVMEIIPYLAIVNNSVKVLLFVYTVMDAKTGEWLGYVAPSAGAGLLAGYSFSSSIGSPVANERIFKNLTDESVGK